MNSVIPRVSQKEMFAFCIFILSFLNSALLIVFFVYLLLNAFNAIKDCVKGLILIAIRTIINPSIAVNIDSIQIIKWLMIFALCFLIIYESRDTKKADVINRFIDIETLFCIFVCFLSIFNSTYPLVSIFKCFSYGFVFISIIIGVSSTCDTTEWAAVLYQYLSVLMVGSILCSPLSFSYYSSAHWFMGLTNHSQMFGIMASLYLALLLLQIINGNRGFLQYCMLLVVAILIFLSGSRTGMISAILCIGYSLYIEVFINKRIYILVIGIIAALVIAVAYGDTVSVLFKNFILKDSLGTNNAAISLDSVTLSRRGQYEAFLMKFNNNPLFGSGFMVPFVSGVRDWSFSFGLIVENGNLFYSVLGDLGIVGCMFFCLTYGYLFVKGSKKQGKLILFIAPFLISMGEMVFFSTNNNAILLYTMFAAFLV